MLQLPGRLALAALAAWLASGCALTDLTLRDPPSAAARGRETRGRGRTIHLVAEFQDERREPGSCGVKKNGYGWLTADLYCATPPGALLARRVREGLERQGFRVIADGATDSSISVEGTLLQVYVEPDVSLLTYTPEADLELRLEATSADGLRAHRRFYVKAQNESFLGTDARFQGAYDRAVTDLVERVVEAIVDLSDRYPGRPAPIAEVTR